MKTLTYLVQKLRDAVARNLAAGFPGRLFANTTAKWDDGWKLEMGDEKIPGAIRWALWFVLCYSITVALNSLERYLLLTSETSGWRKALRVAALVLMGAAFAVVAWFCCKWVVLATLFVCKALLIAVKVGAVATAICLLVGYHMLFQVVPAMLSAWFGSGLEISSRLAVSLLLPLYLALLSYFLQVGKPVLDAVMRSMG